MKRIVLIPFLILIICLNTKAQNENFLHVSVKNNQLKDKAVKPAYFSLNPKKNYTYSGPDKDADYYLHKSKNQRIVGWATLGGGILLSGIGILIANADYGYYDSGSSAAGVITVAGAVSGIVSIPFMILASANKHKAKALLNTQKTGFGVPPGVSRSITGITILIPLGGS